MSNQIELQELARQAALDAAPKMAVGNFVEQQNETDDVVTFFFESKQKGYVGWRWSVSLYTGDVKPSVSEVLLLPGDNSLLAPKWVPWAERLADYKALQAALEEQAALDAEDAEEADDEDEASDEADENELALANIEEAESTKADSKKTSKKQPRFALGRKLFRKKKTGDSAEDPQDDTDA